MALFPNDRNNFDFEFSKQLNKFNDSTCLISLRVQVHPSSWINNVLKKKKRNFKKRSCMWIQRYKPWLEMAPLNSQAKRQNIDFDYYYYVMDTSMKPQQNTSIQAEFAEFSDFTSPRSCFDELAAPPRSTVTTTPSSLEFYERAGPLSASTSSASITAGGILPSDFSRRFSSANSLQTMTNSASSVSFGYYGAASAYGNDFSSPLSPFTTADDTNIIDELFDQDMGLMLETNPSGMLSNDMGSTMMGGAVQPGFGQFRKGSWHGHTSLDILEEVGSQIDATSYVEPDAKSSAETVGSARSIGDDELQATTQEEDELMELDEIDTTDACVQKLLGIDDDFLLADFRTSPDLLVAPHLTSSDFDVQAALATPKQFGQPSAADLFDFDFPDPAAAAVSCASAANGIENVNAFGPLQSMAWSVKEQSPVLTGETQQQQVQQVEDNDALVGIEMPAGTVDDVEQEAVVVQKTTKGKPSRRKRSVDESDADPTWSVKANKSESAKEGVVKKTAKTAGKKRSGKAPTSRVISPRKRVQNRDAAQRYRRRKRDEEKNTDEVLEALQKEYESLRAERQTFRHEFEILRSLLTR